MNPTSGRRIAIMGGGVIGLCAGHFLAKAGHSVVIIDRDPTHRLACSRKNAGMVVPSHFIPLAAPGAISQGLRWMLDRKSPFYLRPSLNPELWRWCWQFFRSSNAQHVRRSATVLRDLSLTSRRLFEELSSELDFNFVRHGLLMLCQTEKGLKEEAEVVEQAHQLGIEAELCDTQRLATLDPNVTMSAIGGVWFPQDGHLDSEEFLTSLRQSILSHGGEFTDGEVTTVQMSSSHVNQIVTNHGDKIEADEFVIAGGAWSPEIVQQLGLRLPMQAGKGYSFTLKQPRQLPKLCSLLKEGRVAVTPMGDDLRVAGTMEIGGNQLNIDPVRLQGIIRSFCAFFPQFEPTDFESLEPWSGLRPCSPDGMPYIGRVQTVTNVIVATGHAMLGLSLGPVTGEIVTRIVHNDCDENQISQLSPHRFG